MSLEEVLKKSKKFVIVPATTLCMLLPAYSTSNLAHPSESFDKTMVQVKRADWEYDLDITVLGFIDMNDKRVKCTRETKEDDDYITETIKVEKSKDGDFYYGYYEGSRKVSKHDPKNDFYEEFKLRYTTGGPTTTRKAKIYPNKAQVTDEYGDWVEKKGSYIGLLSLFHKISEDDFIDGEKFSGDMLYGGYTYEVEVEVEYDMIDLYGTGHISTYEFQVEMKNKDISVSKKKATIWVGRDGIYDGKVLRCEAKPEWGTRLNFLLKQNDAIRPFDIYFEEKKEE